MDAFEKWFFKNIQRELPQHREGAKLGSQYNKNRRAWLASNQSDIEKLEKLLSDTQNKFKKEGTVGHDWRLVIGSLKMAIAKLRLAESKSDSQESELKEVKK